MFTEGFMITTLEILVVSIFSVPRVKGKSTWRHLDYLTLQQKKNLLDMDWYFEKVQSMDFGIWLKQPLVGTKVIVQRTLCSNIQMCLYSRGVEYYLTMLILSYDTWNNTIMRGHDAKHLSDINGSKRLRFDDPFVVCVTNSWKNTVLHWQFSFTNDV